MAPIVLRPLLLILSVVFILGGSFVSSSSGAAFGDEPSPIPLDEDPDLKEIPISELPEPSARVAELIRRGNVQFVYGKRPSVGHTFPAARDGSRRTLAAMTQYRMNYDFRSRNKWHFEQKGSEREVLIRVVFENVRLLGSHTVWFRERPEREGFWESRLVQHELDHVRISTDLGLEKFFKRELDKSSPLRRSFSLSDELTSETINPVVNEHVAVIFKQISELIDVRYQELDRVTDHGLEGFPTQKSIESIMEYTP